MDTFGPGGSVIAAMMAIATGMARHVLCFRTLWEATFQQLMKEGKTSPPGGARTSSWQMPFGATSAAHALALNAQRHFDRYGTTRETLGWIALNQRANAALNPTAIYRDPMTMDDYLNARMITTPFGLYDCDVPCDGAIAVIVSAVDVAKDMPKKPVLFEAVGTQIVERTDWDQTTMTHEPQVLGQSAHMWTRTSLRPKDVDVAELYDGFSFNCLSWLEALGFCGIGEAKDFLDGGKAIARDGVIPLNTHGGQLSHGRTHGMGLIHEAVTQLRGEAGERQVERRPRRGGQQRRPDPERSDPAADGCMSDAQPRPRVVLVDGVPMSALVAAVPEPSAVHRRDPRRRHLRGVFRLPRPSRNCRCCARPPRTASPRSRWTGPGYGASALYHDDMTEPDKRVGFALGAVDKILGESPRGAGLFLLAHSAGCELGAAHGGRRARAADVLGVELSGTGLRYSPRGESRDQPGHRDLPSRRPAGSAVGADGPVSARGADRRPLGAGRAVRSRSHGELAATGLPRHRRAGNGAGRVQRGRARARVGVDIRRRRPPSRALFTVVTASRRQRNAGQWTQSQRWLQRRRLSPTGVVVRRGMCCREQRNWRQADARRIHRTWQPGRPDGTADRRGRLRPDAVGPSARRPSNRSPTPPRRPPNHPPSWPPPATWSACASSATTTSGKWSSGDNGVLAGLASGGIVAIHSTVHPDTLPRDRRNGCGTGCFGDRRPGQRRRRRPSKRASCWSWSAATTTSSSGAARCSQPTPTRSSISVRWAAARSPRS